MDGSSYDGNWADDRREGKGIWKFTNGEVYDGHWHSDKRFGKGKLTLPDGSSYDGEWVNNRKEGKGTFIWSDGTKYSGNWMSDKVCYFFVLFKFSCCLLFSISSDMVKAYLMLLMNHINMLEIGPMIINMVKVFLLIILDSMKENGWTIRFEF